MISSPSCLLFDSLFARTYLAWIDLSHCSISGGCACGNASVSRVMCSEQRGMCALSCDAQTADEKEEVLLPNLGVA